MKPWMLVGVGALWLAFACGERGVKQQTGEDLVHQFGVQIQGTPTMPPLQVAITASRPIKAERWVRPMATVLHEAAKECGSSHPDWMKNFRGVTSIEMKKTASDELAVKSPASPEDKLGGCVAEALKNKKLAGVSGEPCDLNLQISKAPSSP